MFYLTTHSTHFIYGYMASDIWLRTNLIVWKETRCRHIGYSYRLTARVLLYAPSHREDSTYHSLCYTSRGALAGTRNSSMGPPHEGSIRRPIAPWANALPLSYVPLVNLLNAWDICHSIYTRNHCHIYAPIVACITFSPPTGGAESMKLSCVVPASVICTWLIHTSWRKILHLCVSTVREGMFYLTTHSTHFIYGYMASDIIIVKDQSDSERGNPLPPHGLLFPISSKGSFICIIQQTGEHCQCILTVRHILVECNHFAPERKDVCGRSMWWIHLDSVVF